MPKVIKVDFSDPTLLLQDEAICDAIWHSRHPACRKYQRWLCHDCLPSLRRTGKVEGPPDFDAMVRAAVKVAQRNIARRRPLRQLRLDFAEPVMRH